MDSVSTPTNWNSSSSLSGDAWNESWGQENCTSTSCEFYPQQTMFSVVVLAFAKVLYGIVCLIGLVGNTLVIYVVLRFSKMQTVTNMYILNLAFADEMFLVGLPILIVTFVFKAWPFGSILCKLYMTSTSIVQFTSSLLLTVMSADRYVAVCHPISSPRYRTPAIAKCICLMAWLVSALLMIPIFIFANTTENGRTSCNIIWPDSNVIDGQKAFTLYTFTLGFFMPCILILIFYFLVICRLRTVGPKNKSKEKKKSHRKVTILVLTVITVYVLCWLPHWIGQLYITFIVQDISPPLSMSIILLLDCLSYANSAMNPILYAFLSENFKKSFARAFTCAANKETVNIQLQPDNSINPRTTRATGAGGSRLPDRSRLPDQFIEENITKKTQVSRALCQQTPHDEDDDDEDEGDEVDIQDEIPMTSRISSYVGTVVVGRDREIGGRPIKEGNKAIDKQVLIDSGICQVDQRSMNDATLL